MAKRKNTRSGGSRKPSGKAQTRIRTAEDEKRAENARKSRRMGSVFLYAFLSVVGVFCLYTLISLLLFPASSVPALRSNYLFVSLVSVPYLIGAGAVILHIFAKKRLEQAAAGSRRAESLAFFVVLFSALLMFGMQFARGKTDLSSSRVCTAVGSALERSGSEVQELDEAYGYRTVLETMSLERRYLCGDTSLVMNCHTGGGSLIERFRKQARRDYSDFQELDWEQDGLEFSLWPEDPEDPGTIAALCVKSDRTVLILELVGPGEQVKALLPLLQEAAAEALAGNQ